MTSSNSRNQRHREKGGVWPMIKKPFIIFRQPSRPANVSIAPQDPFADPVITRASIPNKNWNTEQCREWIFQFMKHRDGGVTEENELRAWAARSFIGPNGRCLLSMRGKEWLEVFPWGLANDIFAALRTIDYDDQKLREAGCDSVEERKNIQEFARSRDISGQNSNMSIPDRDLDPFLYINSPG